MRRASVLRGPRDTVTVGLGRNLTRARNATPTLPALFRRCSSDSEAKQGGKITTVAGLDFFFFFFLLLLFGKCLPRLPVGPGIAPQKLRQSRRDQSKERRRVAPPASEPCRRHDGLESGRRGPFCTAHLYVRTSIDRERLGGATSIIRVYQPRPAPAMQARSTGAVRSAKYEVRRIPR